MDAKSGQSRVLKRRPAHYRACLRHRCFEPRSNGYWAIRYPCLSPDLPPRHDKSTTWTYTTLRHIRTNPRGMDEWIGSIKDRDRHRERSASPGGIARRRGTWTSIPVGGGDGGRRAVACLYASGCPTPIQSAWNTLRLLNLANRGVGIPGQ
jgi:hypothetical protein